MWSTLIFTLKISAGSRNLLWLRVIRLFSVVTCEPAQIRDFGKLPIHVDGFMDFCFHYIFERCPHVTSWYRKHEDLWIMSKDLCGRSFINEIDVLDPFNYLDCRPMYLSGLWFGVVPRPNTITTHVFKKVGLHVQNMITAKAIHKAPWKRDKSVVLILL